MLESYETHVRYQFCSDHVLKCKYLLFRQFYLIILSKLNIFRVWTMDIQNHFFKKSHHIVAIVLTKSNKYLTCNKMYACELTNRLKVLSGQLGKTTRQRDKTPRCCVLMMCGN